MAKALTCLYNKLKKEVTPLSNTNPEAKMTFTEHLAELRFRLIRSVIAVAVCFLVAYLFHGQIFDLVALPLRPLQQAQQQAEQQAGTSAPAVTQPANPAVPPPPETAAPKAADTPIWTALNPLEPFVVQLRLSLYAGMVLALPIVIYQMCAFIFPGLTPRERNLARILLIGCTFFVIFGVAVAYFGVFPLVLPYLMEWNPAGVLMQLRMGETIRLILLGMLGFAVAFQFPMVVLIFVYLDLLSPATLRAYRKIALVGLAVLSAALTPPDPISMTVMLVPLALLYEMSIWMSYFIVYKRRKAAAASQ